MRSGRGSTCWSRCRATCSWPRGSSTGDRAFAAAWNFGPTDASGDRPVRWVVERFLEAWGSADWTQAGGSAAEPHEAHLLSLDSAKARDELGWAPVWDVETAVRRTADWYREYDRAPADARRLVQDQLRAFQDDARAAGQGWAGAREAEAAR